MPQNDIRTALICFGLDASHGYERTHVSLLLSVAELVAQYISSPPLFEKEENVIGPEKEYPLIKESLEKNSAWVAYWEFTWPPLALAAARPAFFVLIFFIRIESEIYTAVKAIWTVV